jgi:hypothetical protein
MKGAQARELPIERPGRFLLVINLKAAKALGVTIPPSLLLRADHVIEYPSVSPHQNPWRHIPGSRFQIPDS